MSKKKKYTIASTAVSTIGSVVIALIFSSLVIFSLGTISSNAVWTTIIQCLALLIFIPLVYSPAWYCGDHDSNSVQFGHMKENLWKGLQIGLLAAIPFALTPLLLVISKLQIIQVSSGTLDLGFVYRILNVHILYIINLLIPTGENPVHTWDVSWFNVFALWFFHLLIPAITTVSYRLGYLHISLSERIIFKNLSNTNKKNRKY